MTGATEATDLRDRVLAILRERGLRLLDEPVELASGVLSRDFVDAKEAFAQGDNLRTACEALLALATDEGVDFDAAGGLTMGSDHLAHGIALLAGKRWFVIRKEPKGRGTGRLVEGDPLGAGRRVLLVEDVVTTGGSMRRAHEAVAETGAETVLATTLLDRGERAAKLFTETGVRYRPLLTYRDLGIDPV
jgi:orotate phosphoribosyltransferase